MPEQTTLRGTLTEAFDNAEAAATTDIQTTEVPSTSVDTAAADTGRSRDEHGRFAPKAADKQELTATPKPLEAAAQAGQPAPLLPEDLPRPTTWKKEYMPMWEKLATGQQLTPDEAKSFLKYVAHQRENEYKTGVSTYKQEAERARELHQAIEPFMPALQRFQIKPAEWIGNLGRAHQTLALGTPEQKAQMFVQLASEYGVDIGRLAGGAEGQPGQGNPQVERLLQEIQQLKGTVTAVDSWRQQQEQDRVAQAIGTLQNDAEKFPHFEEVRETMAQLLESGLAQDLPSAYAKAIRMDDAVWTKEQARLQQAAQAEASRRNAVDSARRNAVSVKTTTPSGSVTNAGGAKDRRSVISEQLEAAGGRV